MFLKMRPGQGTSERSLAERLIASQMLSLIRRESWPLAGVLALSVAGTALALAQPLLTRHLIDDGLTAGNMPLIIRLCVFMVALGVASSVAGLANRWLYVSSSGRILFALRETVYRHLQTLSPAQFACSSGGDLFARLDGDVAEIQRFGVDAPLSFINSVLALAGALIVMLSLSSRLTLVAFILLPAQVLFLRTFQPRIEMATRRVRERASEIAAFFMDGLPAIKFIQSVNAEAREADRLRALNNRYLADQLRLELTSFLIGGAPGVMVLISTAAIFALGGYYVVEKTLTLGGLIAFCAYLARATGPAQSLLGLYVGFLRMRVSMSRVLDLTAMKPAVTSPANPRPLFDNAKGEIVLDAIRFRYAPDGPCLFDAASLRVRGGMKLGVVGASGVGKSTVVDLLHRHYDPEVGSILLDGVDLRELGLGDLRRRVAVVAQDCFLIEGTLEDNIRFAAPEVSDAAVAAAVELAQLDGFIAGLPQGIQTHVGWRGTALSGGQRQRIAIARAALQNPLVLILDEATSAIDMDGEAQIVRAIDEIFADRTRIVISHRPAALSGCDLVVRVADGRIIPEPIQFRPREAAE